MEMSAHHVTDGQNDWPRVAQVLPSFELTERVRSRVECPRQSRRQAVEPRCVLDQVLGARGAVHAPLGVKNVLAPRLVEADGHVDRIRSQRFKAGCAEPPRSEESWP